MVDRPHISSVVKHLKTFYIFALTSISFKDFPFLKDIIGGSVKSSLSRGWFCMMCHILISACLMFSLALMVRIVSQKAKCHF